jgi:HEAT repeat protein
MTDLKTAQQMMAAAAGKETADPEVTSVKQLLKLLDKTSKSTRTYGFSNPVARKFFQQFYQDLTTHLGTYATLGFLVQRSELHFKGEVVYQTDSSGENLAFKLYADGIRELTFHEGLTQEDLTFFLEALWGGADPAQNDDDDIVTRLWAKNLSTITFVTAEEIIKVSGTSDVLALQNEGAMNAPVSSLRDMIDKEKAAQAKEGTNASAGVSRFQSGLVGYEVSEEELDALAKEIEAESARDGMTYVLDMLLAILASEQSSALLTKLFDVFDNVLETLMKQGRWTALNHVLDLLQRTTGARTGLSDDHRKQLTALLDSPNKPERLKLIEHYLNKTERAATDGLLPILLRLNATAVPALCALLANLESPSHQAIVCEALFTVAKDAPEIVARGLSDKRAPYVRNLLSIIARWNNPKLVDAVERLIRYPDAQIRKEVVRTIGILRPSGNGTKLVSFLNDTDEPVRLAALKLLMNGQYTAPFTVWSTILSAEEFHDRPPAEKRAMYHALRQTAGDEAVPYWQSLFTEWSWTNRKNKEESAVMAAEALGKLGTPAALAALEVGQKKGSSAVRQACATALTLAAKHQKARSEGRLP